MCEFTAVDLHSCSLSTCCCSQSSHVYIGAVVHVAALAKYARQPVLVYWKVRSRALQLCATFLESKNDSLNLIKADKHRWHVMPITRSDLRMLRVWREKPKDQNPVWTKNSKEGPNSPTLRKKRQFSVLRKIRMNDITEATWKKSPNYERKALKSSATRENILQRVIKIHWKH